MIRPPDPENWRPPVGMLLAGWMAWGVVWQLWWIALPVGFLCEAPRYIRQRWQLQEDDYIKIWNACMITTLAVLSYQLFTGGLDETFFLALKWMPLLFVPFALSQFFGSFNTIPILTIAVLARRRRRLDQAAGRNLAPMKRMHLGYPLLALILMSTGARTMVSRYEHFYVVLILVIIALWWNRDRVRNRPILTLACIAMASGIALFSMLTIQRYGRLLQSYSSQNSFKFMPPDPSWSTTRIGQIGHLKQSNRIDWFMEPTGDGAPQYLREASYVEYGGGNWFNHTLNNFSRLGDPPVWEINSGASASEVIIRGRSGDEVAVLPMPYSPGRITRLNADALRTNQLNAVQGSTMPAIIEYAVNHAPGMVLDSPPVDQDLGTDTFLFSFERMKKLTSELWSPADSPEQRLAAVEALFRDGGFRYTMFQPVRNTHRVYNGRSLVPFLTQHRSGHCEYYATATVQLLRRAGIPARYSVGYVASEWDERRNAYVLRARHRHSWAQAWINGQWTIVDTTPPDWSAMESAEQPIWQGLRDRMSTLFMTLSLWQSSPLGKQLTLISSILLAIAILAYLFIRILRGKRVNQQQQMANEQNWPGLDSEFLRVLELIEQSPPPDTAEWQQHFGQAQRLHQAYRFDPRGLAKEKRVALQTHARRCEHLIREISG